MRRTFISLLFTISAMTGSGRRLEDLIDDFLRLFFPESHKLFDLNRGVDYLDKERRRAVFNFLNHFVHFENEETRRDFEKDLQQLTNNNITMGTEEYLLDKARTEGIERGMERGVERGIERGIEKGLRQGKEQFVKYLIVQLGLDDKQIAAAAEVSIEFVQQMRRTAGRERTNSGS